MHFIALEESTLSRIFTQKVIFMFKLKHENIL